MVEGCSVLTADLGLGTTIGLSRFDAFYARNLFFKYPSVVHNKIKIKKHVLQKAFSLLEIENLSPYS